MSTLFDEFQRSMDLQLLWADDNELPTAFDREIDATPPTPGVPVENR